VEREFEIIGEALNRLERLAPGTAARISALRRIVDLRNRIIHAYNAVDDVIVWRTIEQHLPPLQSEVETLLRGEPAGPGSGRGG